MTPRNLKSHASVAEHVLALNKYTKYVSTSSSFPEGSPRFQGKVIHIEQAKKSGIFKK